MAAPSTPSKIQNVPPSTHFAPKNGVLHADGVSFETIAERAGTPTFVYSGAALDAAYRGIDGALADVPHMVAYAVKANSNLSVLARLARLGAGADIVSGGELARALEAGFSAERIVFSGVGKTDAEIRAALQAGIRSLHVESAPEIDAIESVAATLGVRAKIALRVNPNVDAATHPYIATGLHQTKFGLELDVARKLLPRLVASKHLQLEGVACHIGSMVLSPEPIGEAVQITAEFACECARAGATITTLDAGGGWPILYGNEEQDAQSRAVFGKSIIDGMKRGGADKLGVTLVVEPGRSIAGDSGTLLTRVVYVKEQAGKRFVIVDAAMTELIRPALYRAYHAIVPVRTTPGAAMSPCDIVGPVCESGDFFAQERNFPQVARGDLIAIRGAGAYGSVMSSTYNSRPLAAEVLVDGDKLHVVRERQKVEDLWRDERIV
ncbi:MAG TPA: diaminopimelate decarboxylase [Polyangiales bacterium]|nr:diaminopimelate decarboxylase [Polyangiales bacterium]